MNRITIIGRLCADPELRTIPSGAAVCSFRVAVNRRFQREETDFFNVAIWREAATNCQKYLRKGSQVAVMGALQIRQYEQDGVKRQAVEIQADEVEFLGGKNESSDAPTDGNSARSAKKDAPKVSQLEEIDNFGEMPF